MIEQLQGPGVGGSLVQSQQQAVVLGGKTAVQMLLAWLYSASLLQCLATLWVHTQWTVLMEKENGSKQIKK